jgi:hypothetical protein
VTRWRYAERAALLLRRADSRRVPDTAARQRGIATIERALALRAQRRSWRVTGAFAAAAATAAAAVVWLWLGGAGAHRGVPAEPAGAVTVLASPLGAGVTILDAAGVSAVDPGRALQAGARIVTDAHGAAELRLSTGTRLELGGASVLALERRDSWQRFALSRGKLEASVAKLAPQERFVVGTPDAEVEVRGTEFRLRVLEAPAACGRGTRTRLDVQEGVVEVRRAADVDRVGPGEHWPRDCASGEDAVPPGVEAPPASGAQGAASVPAPAARGTASGRMSPAPRSAAAPRGATPSQHLPRQVHSTLPEQNGLFADALRAKQRGDGAAALARYAEFLREFPDSPLAENALVQRMRLLGERDRGLARVEAERYLQRYPHGFAEREARELAEPR